MQDLVNENDGQQETPAVEIPKTEVKTEMTRRGKKEKVASPPTPPPAGKTNPLADFSKEIVGKLVTFYGTVASGIDTIEGVPMSILQDPNGRWFIKFFSSDGARAFLYLDQVATFHTHGDADPAKQPGEAVEENQLKGQTGPYYARLSGEQLPDGVNAPDRRSGLRDPGSIKRVPRTQQEPQA